MRRYLLTRTLKMAFIVLVFLTLVFFMIQAQPGDVTSFYVGNPKVTPEARAAIAATFGLDRPVWQQYLSYVGNFFRGDLGVSFTQYPRPVMSIILERLPRTLMLFLTATMVSFYVGYVLGKIIAWRRGRAIE